MRRLQIGCLLAALGVAATSPWTLRASALESQAQGPGIPSLTEPGEGLAILQTSETGAAAFAATRGQGILLPVAPTDSAAARALAFIDLYGHAFGLPGRGNAQLARPAQRDLLGIEHVKFQQVHQGVPVAGGEFVVHLKGARAIGANGRLLPRLPADMSTSVLPQAALDVARQVIGRYKAAFALAAQYSAPRLEIVDRSFLEHRTGSAARLAWFIEATAPTLRQFIWIDAKNGDLVLQFSHFHTARDRQVYTWAGAGFPGALARMEGGGPTGNVDVDNAYDLSGATYDFFLGKFGRDSYNGAGGQIISTVNYDDPFTCPNAFWSSSLGQMVYCPGFASADDVVGHELTHAVIQHEANLYYYAQSGALNESFADIFGETIDLIQVVTGDAPGDRWLLAEDLPIGVIRNMANPSTLGDPGKVSDFGLFKCDLQDDGGGVHSNSGVPNHAYALMVDGGNYNGYAINGIGLDKAARVQYRALTTYLTSSSGFLDNFTAVNQSCSDLIGTDGITHADCAEVEKALRAVEMNSATGCQDPTLLVQPAMCPAGGTPSFVFQEGFEAGMAGWVASNPTLAGVQSFYVHEGAFSAVSLAPGTFSDHHLASPAPGVVVPPGGRLIFDHSFGFEADEVTTFDGGVLEYSTNNGATWADAASLMDGGYLYNGIIDGGGNPLQGRVGFAKSTPGFVKTRLNLASLAGQTVRVRWRIGTDGSVGGEGWYLDNVRIYSCPGAPGAPTITTQPLMLAVAAGQPATFMVGAIGNATLRYQWLWNGVPIPLATTDTLNIASVQYRDHGYYSVIVSNSAGSATSDAAVLLVVPDTAPTFTNQPESRSIGAGQNAHFVAEVTSPTAVTYQWQFFDGVNGTPVPESPPYSGTATTTLTVTGATIGLNGQTFRLVATNASGSTTSHAARLWVMPGNLIMNGDFSGGGVPPTPWLFFVNPNQPQNVDVRMNGGVFEWNRPGNSSTQATVFQNTGVSGSGPLRAQFDLGNSAPIRQRVSVILLDAPDGQAFFSDIFVCTFWLDPNAPMRTYQMRSRTLRPWINAAIYFYAATTNSSTTNGGYLQLDNVSVNYEPTGSDLRVDCLDPTTPLPTPGAPPSASLITNGDFTGGMASWAPFGTITGDVTNGVFEFIRNPGLPGGVVLQQTGAAVASGEFLTATFDLGNSSARLKRVTLLLHAADFTDLAACTFWLPPGQPLSTYQMKMRATKAWAAGAGTGATFALYGATIGPEPWIQLDNVSLQRTPGSAIIGTECIEPGGAAAPSLAGARLKDEVIPLPMQPGASIQSPREPQQFARLNFDEPFSSEWASGVDSMGTRLLRWKRPVEVDASTASKLMFVSSVEGGAGSAEVQVSLDGFTWRTIARIPPDEAWTEVQVDLSELAGHRVYVQFAYTPLLGEKAVWRVTKVRVSRDE